MGLLVFGVLITLIAHVQCGIETKDSENLIAFAQDYLEQFGYAEEHDPGLPRPVQDMQAFRKHVREFQEFAGLEITGELDEETIDMMERKRCGNKDKKIPSSDDKDPDTQDLKARFKRYVLGGPRWEDNVITYRLTRYSEKFSEEETDADLNKALEMWSEHSAITFKEASPSSRSPVDIDVSFQPRKHGDKNFDGRGGVLAHAFYPSHGDVHVDEAEEWTSNTHEGDNFLSILTHELGHSLGLDHSKDYRSVMWPFSKSYDPDFRIGQDDIAGIQALYGPKEGLTTTPKPTTTTTTTTPATPSPGPVDCSLRGMDGQMEAVTMTEDGTTYIFHGDIYLELDKDTNKIKPGFPKLLKSRFIGLPRDIDAALSFPTQRRYDYNEKTRAFSEIVLRSEQFYFFKGTMVYSYVGKSRRLAPGFPTPIRTCFPGIPDEIDAAFHWGGNNMIYIFKGRQYFRYNTTSTGSSNYPNNVVPGHVDKGFPKPLALWEGLPSSIDAAFQWKNGKTYFFSNNQYYKFNDKEFKVETSPAYPQDTQTMWYGC